MEIHGECNIHTTFPRFSTKNVKDFIKHSYIDSMLG